MITQTADTVNKRHGSSWGMFQRQSQSSWRYTKLRLRVDTIPAVCVPVSVIELSQHLIVKSDEFSERLSLAESEILDLSKTKKNQWRSQVVGEFRTGQSLLARLETQWKGEECTIICATDGGLKDQLGSSSYGFFLPQETEPVLEGFSAEHQPHLEASSTRQELLGQLAAEYWLHDLQKKWGTPRRKLRLILVTDSKASIDIMKSVPIKLSAYRILSHLKWMLPWNCLIFKEHISGLNVKWSKLPVILRRNNPQTHFSGNVMIGQTSLLLRQGNIFLLTKSSNGYRFFFREHESAVGSTEESKITICTAF